MSSSKKGGKKSLQTTPVETVVNVTIPTFPILYQLNNNHKIYEWSIRIESSSGESYDMITSHGEKDGNKVTHIKNIDKGKAKRSVLEQAILEAESKWRNKKEKDLYCETVDETTENVSNNVIVRPMLANTFSMETKKGGRAFQISYPAFVQKKYDGIRCISYKKNGRVVLESRKGIEFSNFEILKGELMNLFDRLPDTFYFDGELYTDRVDFETLSGLVRLSEKKVTSESRELLNQIQYHIYDYVNIERLGEPYEERYRFLEHFLSESDYIKKVRTEVVNSKEEVKTKHDEYVREGYEGIMIREMSGIYEIQKRSKFLQKYKEFMEEEFKIISFHEGMGDEKGCVIWDCENSRGQVFAVKPRGTRETRSVYYENGHQYIGKLLTVIYQELTADGIPRFPVGKGIRDIF